MSQVIQPKCRTLAVKVPIARLRLRSGRLAIALALACLTLSLTVQAAPDGDLGNGNTAEGGGALFNLTTGAYNTAIGFSALYSNSIGRYNTATGLATLYSNTTGNENMANGNYSLYSNSSGSNNTASGFAALGSNTSASNNTATGFKALFQNTTGTNNIALGYLGGFNLTTGSNNIDIGNNGVAGEANTIRIGTVGTQSATFIAGISGTAVAGNSVVVNGNGQLGTTSSSERFKEEIKPMDQASEAILALRPVTFHYKHEIDPEGTAQFGLVAEEVEKVAPALVAHDAQGKVYTVRYEVVNAMLLDQFLKEHRRVQEQEKNITELRSIVAKQQAAIVQQQKHLQSTAAQREKEIQALAARLKEQESQMHRVGDQFEMSKPEPQVVDNDR